jgi:hypothetical protein
MSIGGTYPATYSRTIQTFNFESRLRGGFSLGNTVMPTNVVSFGDAFVRLWPSGDARIPGPPLRILDSSTCVADHTIIPAPVGAQTMVRAPP